MLALCRHIKPAQLESCQIPRQRRPFRGWHSSTTRIRFRETNRPGCNISGFIPSRPSCVSFTTTTSSRRITRTLPSCLLISWPMAFPFPSSVVCKHGRSFVLKLLIKELSISSIIIRWRNPFPWYNAWEGDAYAGGAI
jgi:hypothetical protein